MQDAEGTETENAKEEKRNDGTEENQDENGDTEQEDENGDTEQEADRMKSADANMEELQQRKSTRT
jgi:hypothetical protein